MTTLHTTGVWINAAGATVLRWGPEGLALRERLEADIPVHHRSTGRPPTETHAAREGSRAERLRAFFAQVTALLPTQDDLLLLGDGEVVEHFGDHLAEHEKGRKPVRRMALERSCPLSERQLIARIRDFSGATPRRGYPVQE
jgi:hypothetical protein